MKSFYAAKIALRQMHCLLHTGEAELTGSIQATNHMVQLSMLCNLEVSSDNTCR